MSDEANTAAVTEAAPVEVQAPEPSTPAVVEQGPRSIAQIKQGARQAVMDSQRAKADAAEVARRARDEKGRFAAAPEPEQPTQVEEPVAMDETVSTSVTDETEASEEEALPDGFVKVELPEGSKLRETRGKEFVVVPKEFENDIRYLSKLEKGQAEWDRLKSQLTEVEQAAITAQAKAEYWQSQFKPTVTEEQLAQIRDDIYQAYEPTFGAEFAEKMFEGAKEKLLGENDAAEQEAAQKALWEAEAQRIQSETMEFVDYTLRDALAGVNGRPPRFPGWTEPEVRQALKVYGMYLKAEGRGDVDGKEFVRLAMPMYLQSPAGQKYGAEAARRLQQQNLDQARKQGQQQAEANQAQKLKEAAERHHTNPMGRLPLTKGLAARGIEPEPAQDKANLTPTQIKRQAREAIQQRYGR